MIGTVLQLWVMRFSARYLRVARFFGGIMKRRFLFFIAMLIFALATFMGCSSNSDNLAINVLGVNLSLFFILLLPSPIICFTNVISSSFAIKNSS